MGGGSEFGSAPLPGSPEAAVARAVEAGEAELNEMVLGCLSSRVKAYGPPKDLTRLLEQQAKNYPALRKLFCESAIKSALISCVGSSDVRNEFLIPEDASSLEVLSDGLVEKAGINWPRGEYDDEYIATVKALNKAVGFSEVIWHQGSKALLGISPKIVMKVHDGNINLFARKLEAKGFIKSIAPSLPIPDTHGSYKHPGSNRVFVFMSRAPGQSLDTVWTSLDKTQTASINKQLKSILHELRSMYPRWDLKGHAMLCGGDPCRCENAGTQTWGGEGLTGKELNDFLTKGFRNIYLLRDYLQTKHQVTMTVGNLDPRKIMVDISGSQVSITAILDWDMYDLVHKYWACASSLIHTFPNADCCDGTLNLLRIMSYPQKLGEGLVPSSWRC